jgi:DNA polymerase-3 subunit alpha
LFIILNEIASQKININPPNINSSDFKFVINDNEISYGLSALKGVGEESMKELVYERNKNGIFKNLSDFNNRLSKSILNKRQIEKLILANAFKDLGHDISKLFANVEYVIQKTDGNLLFNESNDDQFFIKKKFDKIDSIDAEFESYGFLYSQKKQTSILSKLNTSSFKEKTDNKIELFEDFYFYVIKSQYKTTKNGKRYILMNVINESGYFDLRLFDDKFDMKSLQANFIKTKIKSSIKNDFYNVNIEKIEIIDQDNLINEITFLSFNDLLELNTVSSLKDIKIKKLNKIFTISLN